MRTLRHTIVSAHTHRKFIAQRYHRHCLPRTDKAHSYYNFGAILQKSPEASLVGQVMVKAYEDDLTGFIGASVLCAVWLSLARFIIKDMDLWSHKLVIPRPLS